MFQTQIIKKQLHFKQPAGTSRGVYTTRDVWYITEKNIPPLVYEGD